ncbi:MAG: CDP-glucose 4,6-dehydratase [Bacteroidetes bacterium]|nr:CDP-glucose 4,6-dehydratase [Bacteroidota bacterium]
METSGSSGIYDIYKSKKVLITGHTGFKGSWLTLWLKELGARVFGYALDPPTNPSLFELLDLEKEIDHEIGDVRDLEQLKKCIQRVKPDIIFHLAAQSLVGKSYEEPLETIHVNTFGTVNLLEAVRQVGLGVAIVLITSDKCYENKEWVFGYRETDTLGGHDPYSASKAATEVLISSWRNSFFNPDAIKEHGVRVASARAGNVIGGGDWSKNRIVPDCIRDLQNHTFISVRNPYSTRPWQHVLEPLSGYLQLGAKLLGSSSEDAAFFCEAFNFGPHVTNNKNVKELVEEIIESWGSGSWKWISPDKANYESGLLNLSIDKAYHKLGWLPKWNFSDTIARTVEWYQTVESHQKFLHESTMIRDFTIKQIRAHQAARSISPQTLLAQEPTSNFLTKQFYEK